MDRKAGARDGCAAPALFACGRSDVDVYGFANGDPVNYGDPYGLWVDCANARACQMWQRVYDRAYAAHRRGDVHGTRVMEMMNAIAESDTRVVLRVDRRGSSGSQWAANALTRTASAAAAAMG